MRPFNGRGYAEYSYSQSCKYCDKRLTEQNRYRICYCSKECQESFKKRESEIEEQKKQEKRKEIIARDQAKQKCPFCGIERTAIGIRAHIWREHTEEGQKFEVQPAKTEEAKRNQKWNKGLTKYDHPSLMKCSKTLKEGHATGRIKSHYKVNNYSKETIHKFQKKRKLPGRKMHYYKHKDGYIVPLESSYEFKVAKSLDENDVRWIRPKFLNWIDEDGKLRKYFPDFYLSDFDIYLDPKNDYRIRKDLTKILKVQEQNKVIVLILNSKQLSWDKISVFVHGAVA